MALHFVRMLEEKTVSYKKKHVTVFNGYTSYNFLQNMLKEGRMFYYYLVFAA